jgi:hypothetical protein
VRSAAAPNTITATAKVSQPARLFSVLKFMLRFS